MSPSFLVKILCYRCRPFTITLASSGIICNGRCLILNACSVTRSTKCYNHFRIRQQLAPIIADDASVMVKGLHL